MLNTSDPDQAPIDDVCYTKKIIFSISFVGLELGPQCLQMLQQMNMYKMLLLGKCRIKLRPI